MSKKPQPKHDNQPAPAVNPETEEVIGDGRSK